MGSTDEITIALMQCYPLKSITQPKGQDCSQRVGRETFKVTIGIKAKLVSHFSLGGLAQSQLFGRQIKFIIQILAR